jgi:protein-S-isoprenylcysteine O-methyltransferase Ste14
MFGSHVLLGFLWVFYCFLHSLLASVVIKKKAQRVMGKHFIHYRLLYTLFAFFSLVAIIYYQLKLVPVVLFSSAFLYYTGIVVAIAGLVLMGICIKKYFMSLSGLRSLTQERPSHQLIITGVHKYIRHPLYLGTFAFLWGFFLVKPHLSLLIADTIITLYTVFAIRLEEAKLVQEFGDDYRQYQLSVPKLWPRM